MIHSMQLGTLIVYGLHLLKYMKSMKISKMQGLSLKRLANILLYLDNLATIWTERIEMELRHENFEKALALSRSGTEVPYKKRSRDEEVGMKVQDRLYRSSKLWSLRLDLEESLGTPASIRDAYTKAMDMKVVTAQMILNYASFLKENNYFEDAFKAYERGISLFQVSSSEGHLDSIFD